MSERVFKSLDGKSFRFACHPRVPCFTECCAKLRLVLTPYDVLRMKTRLGIPSDVFLDRYTDIFFEGSGRFPMVKLKMGEGEGHACPFLRKEGCSIYEDRPGACRLYPLGRAATKVGGEAGARERFFLVEEDHCLGFRENREWRVQEWLVSEGLSLYTDMNDRWLEILTSSESLGPSALVEKKIWMFLLASYNLDRFRDFLFNSRFFDRFEVDAELKGRIKTSDVDLMLFAFEWLKYTMFGKPTLSTKEVASPPNSEAGT